MSIFKECRTTPPSFVSTDRESFLGQVTSRFGTPLSNCQRQQNIIVCTEDQLDGESNSISAGDLHTIDAAWQSLDYDICENSEYRMKEKTQTKFSHSFREFMRWTSFAAIGLITGAIAIAMNTAIEKLSELKIYMLNMWLAELSSNEPELAKAPLALVPGFLIWIGVAVVYVAIAAGLTVFFQPAAGGSGVPQLLSYLNGIRVRAFLGFDALVVKVIGTGLSVASGLAVGQEGPMVHVGSIVAAGVADGTVKLPLPSCSKPVKNVKYKTGKSNHDCLRCRAVTICTCFQNDHDKRDFVSAGGAAGLAAAFGTPITGVLFALEEGASFWNHRLTLGLLLSSMMSTFTVFFINTIIKKETNLINEGVFSFGNVTEMQFDIFEIPLLVIVGVVGGLLGALFNFLNKKIAHYRFHYLHDKITLALEPVLVVATISTIAFCLCFVLVPSCSKSPLDDDDKRLLPRRMVYHNCGEKSAKAQLHCKEGEYSTTSLLFLQIPERAARTLFLCENPDHFEGYTLLLFFSLYFLFTCWCCGISVPSGIFVPNFLVGAAWGRLLGVFFYHHHPQIGGDIRPGKYAVFGAAAQMAGVTRMTLTLTCMVAEGTGNVAFGLPIMLICVIAKFIGELLSEGIYEEYLRLLAVPFLNFDPPTNTANIAVIEVANQPVVTLRVVDTVARILEVVQTTEHSGFPVVDDAAGLGCSGGLTGLLRRDQLFSILASRQFSNQFDEDADDETQPLIGRKLRISDIVLRPNELSQAVDLRPFMNPAPYAVLDQASLSKVFRLFRGLGLRHLCVVNRRNEVVGIVTRKDLAVWENRRQNETLPVSEGIDFE